MQPIYQRCFQRDGFKCRHCSDRNGIHPHHVIYRSQGGQDVLNNLITLCAQCHLIGIHQRNLILEVVEVLDNDVIVKFTRAKGWKPV
jgi:type II secretory ATPase GspE/PulE/Tfp pilus assembly ATPase PilB-like protein